MFKTKEELEKHVETIGSCIEMDRYFLPMLEQLNGSIIVNLFNSGVTIALGLTEQIKPVHIPKQISVTFTSSQRAMGACVTGEGNIWIGNQIQLVNYRKHTSPYPDKNEVIERTPFDGYYLPREIMIVGDIDVHDMEACGDALFFVSTLFNSICTRSKTHGFKLHWTPPWISNIGKPEDRCHLNGFCCVNGTPRYATSASRSDTVNGWRDVRKNGGVVWDIEENKLITCGLSMPHSPRWYHNRLYVLNSGCGEFGYIDFNAPLLENHKGEKYHPFVRIAFIPSFLRGLTFTDHYAIIGGSNDRHESLFDGLPLHKELIDREVSAKCGIFIVDLDNGSIVNSLTFEGDYVKEIYDVAFVPLVSRLQLEEYSFPALSRTFTIENTQIK